MTGIPTVELTQYNTIRSLPLSATYKLLEV
ncbi:unnamed protein product, partial [Rotaria sp. Silwood1]